MKVKNKPWTLKELLLFNLLRFILYIHLDLECEHCNEKAEAAIARGLCKQVLPENFHKQYAMLQLFRRYTTRRNFDV